MNLLGCVMSAFDTVVDTFLSNTTDTVGEVLHMGVITTSGTMVGNVKKGGGVLLDMVISPSDLIGSVGLLDFTNDVTDMLRDPNINGIPLATPSIKVTREADVSENPFIFGEGLSKMNLVDCVSPHPRVWNLTGYLTSIPSQDVGFTLKPSLSFQADILDAYMRSRRPVWFKTNTMEFVLVVISHLEIEDTAEATNTRKVTVTLNEWLVMDLESKPTSVLNMMGV